MRDEIADNCPTVFNPEQLDDDADGIGNAARSTLSYKRPTIRQ